jgi:hypothetical protein
VIRAANDGEPLDTRTGDTTMPRAGFDGRSAILSWLADDRERGVSGYLGGPAANLASASWTSRCCPGTLQTVASGSWWPEPR